VKRYQVDRRSVIELNGCTAEENGCNKRWLNRNEVVSFGLALAVVCSLLACQTAPQTAHLHRFLSANSFALHTCAADAPARAGSDGPHDV
jgi:hypothetical protein